MPRNTSLFDPVRFLEGNLRLKVREGKNGQILLDGMSYLSRQQRRQAVWVLRTYHDLIYLQLSAPGKARYYSVQKLIALGKIKIEKGKYVKIREDY